MKGENVEWLKWKLIVCCLTHTPKCQVSFMVRSTVDMIRMEGTLREVPAYEQRPGCSKSPAEDFTTKTASEGLQSTCINLYCLILHGKEESCPIGYFISLATSSGLTVVTFQPPDKRAVFGQLTLQNLCENAGNSLSLSPLWNSLAALVQGVHLECRMTELTAMNGGCPQTIGELFMRIFLCIQARQAHAFPQTELWKYLYPCEERAKDRNQQKKF